MVEQGFDNWSKGAGNFFDLLASNVVWTITGNSPIAKTYTSRAQFLQEAIDPLNRRLTKKIVPVEWVVYAEGDVVAALWSGQATAKDGQPYNNTYAWFMTFRGGKIAKVTAFFDSIELAQLWKRVPDTRN